MRDSQKLSFDNLVEMRDGKRKHSVAAVEESGEEKEKKMKRVVFDLPGQKRPAPGERDPSRIFYETLYKQVPGCELARIWMMESGLLSREEAEQVYHEKKQRKPSSPTSAADVSVGTSVNSERLSRKKKKKKKEKWTRVTVKKSRKHKDED